MSANREVSQPESEQLRQGLAFLHQAREVPSLEPAQIDRIERRLKGRRHHPRRTFLLPAVAALGLILIAGAAFAVARGGLRSLPIVGPLFAPGSSIENSKSDKHRRTLPKPTVKIPPVPQPTPVTPAVVPTIRLPLPAAWGEGRGEGPRRTLALRDPGDARQGARADQTPESPAQLPAADKGENPIVAESRSFATVIEPWHRTHNAGAALALLDAHERRYPDGHMRLESRVLRAEIYLSQSRGSDALGVLDSLALSGIPRARELQTVRGELRIKAGRCAEGKRDLGEVLEKGVVDALAKRATQAISHCP